MNPPVQVTAASDSATIPIPLSQLVELGVNAHTMDVNADGHSRFVLLPNGSRIEDVSKFFPPTRIVQGVNLSDASSFIAYVNRFKTDSSLIFTKVTEVGASFVAVLDYHNPEDYAAGECKHMVRFDTTPTEEWKAWLAANRKQMSQVDFATWLEENMALFSAKGCSPTGADLLELVQNLTGKNDVRFTSALRLDSGANSLNFEEDVELKGQISTKGGQIKLPRFIKAGISPFLGAPVYEVQARLKYRIESRKLALWFETMQQHLIVRESVQLVVKDVKEKTKIEPLMGSASTP